MEWIIDSGSMPLYLRVETNGEASEEDFAAMWDAILGSESWRPGLPVLMDNRKLEPIKDPGPFTMSGIEYFAINASLVGKACIATISLRPENLKYSRQFQYGTRLRGSDVVLQIFGSETQAVDWLTHYGSIRDKEDKATNTGRS